MTQEFVTLPREVVKRALAALDAEDPYRAAIALRAALEQPQNHVPDVGNMVQAGWKLVPIEPTEAMHQAAVRAIMHCTGNDDFPPAVYRAMLAAAPQPPTTEQYSAVEQSQAEQKPRFFYDEEDALLWTPEEAQYGPEGMTALYTHPQPQQEPVAWLHRCNKNPSIVELSFSKREPKLASKGYKAHPLYTRQQPKREPLSTARIDELIEEGIFGGNPYELVRRIEEERGVFMTRSLTREKIMAIQHELSDTVGCSYETMARAIEAAHNIK